MGQAGRAGSRLELVVRNLRTLPAAGHTVDRAVGHTADLRIEEPVAPCSPVAEAGIVPAVAGTVRHIVALAARHSLDSVLMSRTGPGIDCMDQTW